MDKSTANKLIIDTFSHPFDETKFLNFSKNLFVDLEIDITEWNASIQSSLDVKNNIEKYKRLGTFEYENGEKLSTFIVKLKSTNLIGNIRAIHANIAKFLIDKSDYDAILIAYFSDNYDDWRFSFVKQDYQRGFSDQGDIQIKKQISSVRRFSYLVGKHEPNHTAQSQLAPLIFDEKYRNPSINDLHQAFSVEKVSQQFFDKYKILTENLKNSIEKLRKQDQKIDSEFRNKNIDNFDFSKKLMGQIIFIYFIQKKGWIGIKKDVQGNFPSWGSGPRDFFQKLFKKEFCDYKNFYNDVLEHLFYNDLASENVESLSSKLDCKVPFLNGGLFEPLNSHNWQETDILIENEIFERIIETFDQFNFTIQEEDSLEADVAVDPEMLGRVFENLLTENVRKSGGAFYTPRSIVNYMCKESLSNYLVHTLNDEIDLNDFRTLLSFEESNSLTLDLEKKIKPFFNKIDEALKVVKICDPAIGSGAFPVAIMNIVVNTRNFLSKYLNPEKKQSIYDLKKHCIQENIYGVDEDSSAVEIAKLRLWLSLIVEVKHYKESEPLPNLDYKIIQGNSLIENFNGISLSDKNLFEINEQLLLEKTKESSKANSLTGELNKKQDLLLNCKSPSQKKILKKEIDELIIQVFDTSIKAKPEIDHGNHEILKKDFNNIVKNFKQRNFFPWNLYFKNIFATEGGFDIVIANPPYVNAKEIEKKSWKDELKKNFGFKDDLYNHFTFLAFKLLKESGFLCLITSDTFLTLQTKLNMRKLLLANKILSIIPTPKAFKAMVDTCIFLAQKKKTDNDYAITYNDIRKNEFTLYDDDSTKLYRWDYVLNRIFNSETLLSYSKKIKVSFFKKNLLNVFFSPTEDNLDIYNKYIPKIKVLYDYWWEKIKTSKEIKKNFIEIESYQKKLKIGDLTLLGLITEGGQGLATGNNGDYIGCLEGTNDANRILETRPEKLKEVFDKFKDLKNEFDLFKNLNNLKEYKDTLKNLKEERIRELFFDIKQIKGRDCFGQGYLYRIISNEEVADENNLTNDNFENGINSSDPHYIQYHKGDKEGRRWYVKTPYYIKWDKKSVSFLKTNKLARWQGYDYYFKDGFCWSDIHTNYLKSRIKIGGVHDVVSMTLLSKHNFIPNYYLVSLINSDFASNFQQEFLNNTSHFQMNDARKLPVVIPTQDDLNFIKERFDQIIDLKKNNLIPNRSEKELSLEEEINNKVSEIYLNIYG